VILLAEKLRFQSDAVVIGIFLSSTAITYFSIASRLAEYSGYVVQAPAKIFTPMSSQSDAAGDLDRLQKIFVVGNRVCALTIFPLCAALIVLGKSIIEVWVGAKYLSSYPILLLLVVPKTLYLAQATSVKILLGIGRHRMLALVLLLEGAANLVLSVVLLRRWGILGVTLGTTIPLSCTSLLFLPRHLCRLLNIPLLAFLRQAYLLPLGLCAPLVGALLLLKQVFQAHSYSQLLAQVAGGGIVYGAGLVWLFFGKERRGLAHSAGDSHLQ
jgi:O-antigen/teichoic acid export membrane protein